jgi:hypothetical protein
LHVLASSVIHNLLRCMSPLLAQSGHRKAAGECPLSEVKQTLARLLGLELVSA